MDFCVHLGVRSAKLPHKPTNGVLTAHYTKWNFLPKNLFEQMSTLSNLYVFFMAIMQTLPPISVTNGLPTLLIPLSGILFLKAIADAYYDFRRHISDNLENGQKTTVYETSGRVTQVSWKDVCRGDILILENRDVVPADILLLSSSRADGRVMVETASLDGETNLKARDCVPNAPEYHLENNIPVYEPTDIHVRTGHPCTRLDAIDASVNLCPYGTQPTGGSRPVELNSVIFRGSRMRNMAWATGVVLYTGHDTKAYQYDTKLPPKRSRLVRIHDEHLIYIVLIEMCVCLFMATWISLLHFWSFFNTRPYLAPFYGDAKILGPFYSGITGALSWMMLICNMVPVTLMVFVNFCQLIQAVTVATDKNMATEDNGSAYIRNPDLNSDLGQVSQIFTDKTGTLTKNYMQLSSVCINDGVYYGKRKAMCIPHVDLESHELHVRGGSVEGFYLFLNLSVNNGAYLEDPFKPTTPEELPIYNVSSHDEASLVYGAFAYGYRLVESTAANMIVIVRGKTVNVEILGRFDFTSEKKRSSVLCRVPPVDGLTHESQIVLFCKGADFVLSRLCKETEYKKCILDNCLSFAENGLRSLCFGHRGFTEVEYQEWELTRYETEEPEIQLEQDMTLIGCVGIEDILDDGVPETLAAIEQAGIKVWVLTGDKVETSINVGGQLGLIREDTELWKIASMEDLEKFIHISPVGCALAVDCSSVDLMSRSHSSIQFLKMAMTCSVALMCRCTPQLKAKFVTTYREHCPDKVTLAIGDGGNDCQMIHAANLGIGVRGQEGLQAVNASDVVVPRFSCLSELLFVHGRLIYRQLAKMILLFCYKMLLVYVPQILFCLPTLYSGQRFFLEIQNQLYNALYTVLPCVVIGAVDADLDRNTLLTMPAIYRQGMEDHYLNKRVFTAWMLRAAYQGTIAYLVPMYIFDSASSPTVDGWTVDFWFTGTVAFFACTCLSLGKCILQAHSSFVLVLLTFFPSFIGFWLSLYLFSGDLALKLMRTPSFYSCTTAVILLGLLPDVIWKIRKHRVNVDVSHWAMAHVAEKKLTPPVPFPRRPSVMRHGHRISEDIARSTLFYDPGDRSFRGRF